MAQRDATGTAPRGNQDPEELRRSYRELSAAERLERGMRLSRFAAELRAAGRRARPR